MTNWLLDLMFIIMKTSTTIRETRTSVTISIDGRNNRHTFRLVGKYSMTPTRMAMICLLGTKELNLDGKACLLHALEKNSSRITPILLQFLNKPEYKLLPKQEQEISWLAQRSHYRIGHLTNGNTSSCKTR